MATFFFFNDTATTEIYTLSLHDALPIWLFFERVIHGEIYKARADVMAVVHNHSPSLIPFCNSDTKLRPMVGNAAFLGDGAPVFDIRTVDDDGDLNICTAAQASAMAQALGRHWLVLLRGHRVGVVGETVPECV